MATKKRETPRKTLSDHDFISGYLAHSESKRAYARTLGISHQAIGQRVAKLSDEIARFKNIEPGVQAAAIIERNIPKRGKESLEVEVFQSAVSNTRRQYHIFDHLEDLYEDIRIMLTEVKANIASDRDEGKPVNGFHVDQMVKLVNQARTLITDAHKTRIELLQAKNVEAFITAVTIIIMTYDPDVRSKLFAELSGLGVEGQTALLFV